MLFPSQEISQLSQQQGATGLISPFTIENLRGSSYDLTIGEEYYVGQDISGTKLTTEKLEPDQAFWIPPHAVCFILSAETLTLPDYMSAKVSLRMGYIYAGLVLTSQPPFDPGYTGRAIVLLHNLSSESICMRRGARVATIEFFKLNAATTLGKKKGSVESISKMLSRPLTSSLSEIADQSTETRRQVQFLIAQLLVFAALIVAVLAVPGFLSFSGMMDRLNDQKTEIAEQKKQLQDYKDALDAMKLQLNQTLNSSRQNTSQSNRSTPKGPN